MLFAPQGNPGIADIHIAGREREPLKDLYAARMMQENTIGVRDLIKFAYLAELT